MEGRIRSLLLIVMSSGLLFSAQYAHAEELSVEQVSKPVIQPDIERMNFEESRINPDNFEVIASVGTLSIEDFGVGLFYGAKLAYRVSENFFVDLELGTSQGGQSSVETLFGTPIMSDSDRRYSYYLINLAYDILPGESFITRNTTYNTALYFIAGAGNTQFGGADNFTLSWGFGYRVVLSSFLTTYIDVRDHSFNMDLFGTAKRTNNIEISLGVGFYF